MKIRMRGKKMGYTNVQVKDMPTENYDYYRNHKNPADTGGEYLLHIYTLGKFEVYSKGAALTEDSKRAVRMWNLFKYILTHRRKMLSTGELIDILWGEDSCENPEKALQNLIYRLRQMLSANGVKADDLILFTQGCYKWNDNFPVWLDCDVLSDYCNKGMELSKMSMYKEARNCFEKAIELYNGDFFNEIIYDMWILPQRTSYKKTYADCVNKLLEILEETKDSEAILRICNHFFNHEYLDETTNIYFLNALISLNKKKEAQKHHARITQVMQTELGIRPSYEFTEINRKIEAIAYKSNMENKKINLE
jgi:DNA-binding SARP family transcriptional activator